MTLRETPVCASFIFNKKITDFTGYHSENNSTAAAFVKAFKSIVFTDTFRKFNCRLYVVYNKACAFGCNNPEFFTASACDDGDNSPVKIPHRMVNAHNIGKLLISCERMAFYSTVIELISIALGLILGIDCISNIYPYVLTQHWPSSLLSIARHID